MTASLPPPRRNSMCPDKLLMSRMLLLPIRRVFVWVSRCSSRASRESRPCCACPTMTRGGRRGGSGCAAAIAGMASTARAKDARYLDRILISLLRLVAALDDLRGAGRIALPHLVHQCDRVLQQRHFLSQ